VGGYLNTALANKNGELVLPVIVTGTTNHPKVAPDIQQIAKMKLSGLLNGKGGHGLGGLLGGILDDSRRVSKHRPSLARSRNRTWRVRYLIDPSNRGQCWTSW